MGDATNLLIAAIAALGAELLLGHLLLGTAK